MSVHRENESSGELSGDSIEVGRSSIARSTGNVSQGASGDLRSESLTRQRGSSRWLCIMLTLTAMAIVTGRLFEGHPLRSANDRSRWCTVWSIVERGTYQIDEIRQRPGWDSIDIVQHEGHFYSSKPPLLSRMVAELYRFIRFTLGWNLDQNLELTTRLILVLINIIPWTIALLLLGQIFRNNCRSPFGLGILTTTACAGTLVTPFLTVFNNHTVAATAVVYAVALAVRIVEEHQLARWRFFACGLCSGFAACNELPAIAFAVGMFIILNEQSYRRAILAYIPGLLIPVALFALTNYQATGGFEPFYMSFGTEKYNFVHEGVPSYWMEPKGVDRNLDHPLLYVVHCLVGHHGLFSLSPILLLTLIGWGTNAGWSRPSLRHFRVLGLVVSAIVFAFYVTKTSNYNYGGVSIGLRWMIWLMPLWLITMIPVLNEWGNDAWMRWLSIPLLCISIFSAWYPQQAPWRQPWLFDLMTHWGWIDYSNPRPVIDGNRHTWLRKLPEGDLKEDYWVEWQAYAADGGLVRLRLADAGPLDMNGVVGRLLNITRSTNGQAEPVEQLVIDVQAHSQGKPPHDFLVWPGGATSVDNDTRRAAENFLAGIPGQARYNASRIHYVKTAVRKEAFKCLVSYIYVTIRTSSTRTRVVRDAWFTDEIPFGLLRWEEAVLDADTAEQYSRQEWNLRAAGSQSDYVSIAPARSDPD